MPELPEALQAVDVSKLGSDRVSERARVAAITERVHMPARRGEHPEAIRKPFLTQRSLVDAAEVIRAAFVRLHPPAFVKAILPRLDEFPHSRLNRGVPGVEPVREEIDLGHIKGARRGRVQALEDCLVGMIA